MERVLIVNADDFGLSKGQNYGIIEACRNGDGDIDHGAGQRRRPLTTPPS